MVFSDLYENLHIWHGFFCRTMLPVIFPEKGEKFFSFYGIFSQGTRKKSTCGEE